MAASQAADGEGSSITALTPVTGRERWVAVRVGRRVAARLTAKSAEQLGLNVGQPWSAELEAQVSQAAAQDQALRQALKLSDRRPLSRAALEKKLRERGIDATAAGQAAQRAEELGAIDDATLGRELIREIQARRPAGPALLRAKLKQRGLNDTLIDQLVEQAASGDSGDQHKQALALARQQLARMSRADRPAQQRRLGSLLARRGFDHEIVQDVLETLLGGGDIDEDAAWEP